MKRTSPVRVTLLAALAALLPALAVAADAPQAVLAAHDARIAATIKGDVAALGAMMTDDLTYTHSSGITETKAEFLDGLKTGKYLYRAIDASGRRVRVHGDSALVSGPCHIVIEPGGKRTELDLYFSELYVREGGAWRMALWQSTRLPAPAAAPSAPLAPAAPLVPKP
jgi:ketosteroid isomerase-like protein